MNRLLKALFHIKEDAIVGQYYCFIHTQNFPTIDALKRHIWVEHPGITQDEARAYFEKVIS